MQTELLSKLNAKLNRLSLSRIQLHREDAHAIIQASGHEQLLYLLTGSVRVLEYREAGAMDLGTFGGRRSVWEPGAIVLRLHSSGDAPLSLLVASETADMLLVSCEGIERDERERGNGAEASQAPRIQAAAREHQVGEGSYERVVREFPPPPGYEIHVGETLNNPGSWSSWPSHASNDDLPNHALHEEVFMVFTRGYGLIMLDGIYCDGQPIQTARKVHNGDVFVTPLGDHPICASPDQPLAYFWAYVSGALKKEYRQWATDMGVYRR